MDKLSFDDFKLKITNASPVGLIVINFDIILTLLDEACVVLNAMPATESDQERADAKTAVGKSCDKALKFLNELILALNMEIPLSHTLFRLYSYTNKLITNGAFRLTLAPLSEATEILSQLRHAFAQIEQSGEADHKPVVDNAERIYAGLTYGKGSLNEAVVSEGGRGFKA